MGTFEQRYSRLEIKDRVCRQHFGLDPNVVLDAASVSPPKSAHCERPTSSLILDSHNFRHIARRDVRKGLEPAWQLLDDHFYEPDVRKVSLVRFAQAVSLNGSGG